jgi:phosphoribosylformylglycinamidine cyclo-ligase
MAYDAREEKMNDFYKEHGVDSGHEEKAMKKLLHWINPTFAFRKDIGKNLLPIGFFANIVDLGTGKGLALSMDGVGTKILIAEKLGKYDTLGIDCIAMNVNDLLCVGAEPLSFMDYIAVSKIQEHQIEELAKGFYEGARQAEVNIPGGELAQVKELLHPGETSIDLVGTAVGIIDNDKIITGKHISPGDIIIGLKSSGIHSNGLTLARKLLLGSDNDERAILEELLIPTRIYVKEVMTLLKNNINIKGMAHITGEGFLNILRLQSNARYIIQKLPQTPSIFDKIQKAGNIADSEMYKDFNMGIGFVMIIDQHEKDRALSLMSTIDADPVELGYIEASPCPRIDILPKNITSQGDKFECLL